MPDAAAPTSSDTLERTTGHADDAAGRAGRTAELRAALATMFRALGYRVVPDGQHLAAVHDIGHFGVTPRGEAPTGEERFTFLVGLDEAARRLTVRTHVRRMARPGPVSALAFDEFGNEVPREARFGPKRLVTLEGQVRAELVLEDHVPLPDGSVRIDYSRFDSEEARLDLLDIVREFGWTVVTDPQRDGHRHVVRARRVRRDPLLVRLAAAVRRHRAARPERRDEATAAGRDAPDAPSI